MELPMSRSLILLVGLLAAATASAADPKPEVQRPVGAAQAVGMAHTLRVIPEACVRLMPWVPRHRSPTAGF